MINKVGPNNSSIPQNSVRDAYSYFSRVTGQRTGLAKQQQQQQHQEQIPEKPAGINVLDRVNISGEAREEAIMAKSGENHQDNPLNMDAFLQNLGLKPPEKSNQEGMSLGRKLEMLSLKTAGQGW
ncbi:MAG: hypothetical protein K8T10_16720 [Candidatus Eremiobacteraeota bacterium]|nr:hypothetical protein [Candidatus Eremiobacteraeota bacterium]